MIMWTNMHMIILQMFIRLDVDVSNMETFESRAAAYETREIGQTWKVTAFNFEIYEGWESENGYNGMVEMERGPFPDDMVK
jgi:hypothetical protein